MLSLRHQVGALALALLCWAAGAQAGTITYSPESYVTGAVGTTIHFEVPQYQGSLGQLVSVQVGAGVMVEDMGFEVANTSSSYEVGSLSVERNLSIEGPGVSATVPFYPGLSEDLPLGYLPLPGYVASYVIAPSGVIQIAADSDDNLSTYGPTSLAPYVGAGRVGFDLVVGPPLAIASSNPNFAVTMINDGYGYAGMFVTYTYLPEPDAAPLLAVGLALGALSRRRRDPALLRS